MASEVALGQGMSGTKAPLAGQHCPRQASNQLKQWSALAAPAHMLPAARPRRGLEVRTAGRRPGSRPPPTACATRPAPAANQAAAAAAERRRQQQCRRRATRLQQ